MENVLQIHTEAVSAQIAHFYEVCIRIIALLGPVERQTSYKRLTYFTSQLPLVLAPGSGDSDSHRVRA